MADNIVDADKKDLFMDDALDNNLVFNHFGGDFRTSPVILRTLSAGLGNCVGRTTGCTRATRSPTVTSAPSQLLNDSLVPGDFRP